jgi:hypothetical protein
MASRKTETGSAAALSWAPESLREVFRPGTPWFFALLGNSRETGTAEPGRFPIDRMIDLKLGEVGELLRIQPVNGTIQTNKRLTVTKIR